MLFIILRNLIYMKKWEQMRLHKHHVCEYYYNIFLRFDMYIDY